MDFGQVFAVRTWMYRSSAKLLNGRCTWLGAVYANKIHLFVWHVNGKSTSISFSATMYWRLRMLYTNVASQRPIWFDFWFFPEIFCLRLHRRFDEKSFQLEKIPLNTTHSHRWRQNEKHKPKHPKRWNTLPNTRELFIFSVFVIYFLHFLVDARIDSRSSTTQYAQSIFMLILFLVSIFIIMIFFDKLNDLFSFFLSILYVSFRSHSMAIKIENNIWALSTELIVCLNSESMANTYYDWTTRNKNRNWTE